MVSAAPPKGIGRMARREMRLAYTMLLPTFLIVLAIVLWPLLANFWISAKPVQLGDLRPATLVVNERLRGDLQAAGDTGTLDAWTLTIRGTTVAIVTPTGSTPGGDNDDSGCGFDANAS